MVEENKEMAPNDNEVPIAKQFERVIEVNRQRGYTLHSWRLSQIVIPNETEKGILETIVAVFVKTEVKAANN